MELRLCVHVPAAWGAPCKRAIEVGPSGGCGSNLYRIGDLGLDWRRGRACQGVAVRYSGQRSVRWRRQEECPSTLIAAIVVQGFPAAGATERSVAV